MRIGAQNVFTLLWHLRLLSLSMAGLPQRSHVLLPLLIGILVWTWHSANLFGAGAPKGRADRPALPEEELPWSPPESPELSLSPEDLGFEEILFVKRRVYSSKHYYTDIDECTNPDRFDPRNGIYIYNLRTGEERPVITAAQLPGGKGFIGSARLSPDATRVVFDFRERPGAGYRIWEVNLDGTGLRQLTFSPPDEAEKIARWGRPYHIDDIHPAYLPDGSIVFASNRCEHTILCGGSAHLSALNLYRLFPDGQIHRLTFSPVSEFCPLPLLDGRLLYHRWEYVDKGARVAKTLWSMNYDGTFPQELYGLADDTTTIYMYPQPLPGRTDRFVCVGTCHYPQGGCLGAILLVDAGRGQREPGPLPNEPDFVERDPRWPVINITPHVCIDRRTEPGWYFRTRSGRYVHDKEGARGHLYTHPFPITDRLFLASYKMDPFAHYQNVPNAYGIILLDIEGRHRLVHRDPHLSCWHPTPILPRPAGVGRTVPRNPSAAAKNEAICIVTNITDGMDGVRPGEVKWLRINEVLPRYWSTGRRWDPSISSSSWKAALWPRVQWGVVPVEADGSAHFVVPAGRAIFLQALDENFREIQRERTYVNYAPGEIRSCNGCHGQRNRTPPVRTDGVPLALRRPPSRLMPQPCDLVENGGDGKPGQVIHYPTDIQPIWDAKCISCHGSQDPAGGLRLTGEPTLMYSISYEELAKRELAGPLIAEFTSFLKGDQGNYNGAYLPPKSLGSYASELVRILTDPAHPKNATTDHTRLLTPMELMRVCRWVDSNYQFYGSYFGRQHIRWLEPDPNNPLYDPRDFRRRPTFEEAISFLAPPWHR